jgi:hypothetical protein
MEKTGTVRLTVFFRHDQTKNLDEIDSILYRQGFWSKFPPDGVQIISWQVLMGIGHVVTLQIEAEKVRAVNLAIEKMAWGAFKTEFYLTYDYMQVLESKRAEAQRAERSNRT